MMAFSPASFRVTRGYSEAVFHATRTRTGRTSVLLRRTEYGVLELLSLHEGTVVTKEMLLKHLYAGIQEPELKIIDVFVRKLRKKNWSRRPAEIITPGRYGVVAISFGSAGAPMAGWPKQSRTGSSVNHSLRRGIEPNSRRRIASGE
jgi:hypothetical protein